MKLRRRTWWRIYSGLFLLALVGGAAFGAYSGRSTVGTPGDAATNLGTVLGLSHAAWVTIFTLALVIVGVIQFLQLRRTNDSAAKIERAYVKMSHHPPGLEIGADKKVVRVHVYVKNFGNTPARVTDALLVCDALDTDERLPTKPNYAADPDREVPKAFLVAGDDFSYWQPFGMPVEWEMIASKKKKLCFFGYVDYIDAFGQRLRSGYARVYKPVRDDPRLYASPQDHAKRSNLVFVTQEGYDYDRQRTLDEGNDWNLVVD